MTTIQLKYARYGHDEGTIKVSHDFNRLNYVEKIDYLDDWICALGELKKEIMLADRAEWEAKRTARAAHEER